MTDKEKLKEFAQKIIDLGKAVTPRSMAKHLVEWQKVVDEAKDIVDPPKPPKLRINKGIYTDHLNGQKYACQVVQVCGSTNCVVYPAKKVRGCETIHTNINSVVRVGNAFSLYDNTLSWANQQGEKWSADTQRPRLTYSTD